MRLACVWTADQEDVVGVVEEVAAMKLTDQRLVDLAGGKIEAIQITIGGKAGGFGLIGTRSHPRSAVSAFRSYDRIGMAASNACDPCSVSSPTACAMP